MPALTGERLGIIGLGAVGGSLALAWPDRDELVAWARDESDRAAARAAGITISSDDTWRTDVAGRTAVVVAVPLSDVTGVVRELISSVPDECLIMHTTSLQMPRALGLDEHQFRRVLGTHPIAGSERSGFVAAHGGMFRGATLRAEARATPGMRARIERIWRHVGISRIVWEDASVHDALMAWVSHLPQLAATALAAVLGDRGIAPEDAGPGARDTTRLASSDPGMWTPILQAAPPDTIDAVDRLRGVLEDLRNAVAARDAKAIGAVWDTARAWRASVEGRR
jgi:prephenate dehydrogenase